MWGMRVLNSRLCGFNFFRFDFDMGVRCVFLQGSAVFRDDGTVFNEAWQIFSVNYSMLFICIDRKILKVEYFTVII